MWSTSAAAPGKAIGTAVASSQLPEIMANGRNHSTGMGRKGSQTSRGLEGQRKATWRAALQVRWEVSPGERETCK